MTAPTTSVRFLLARAAVRSTGALHIVSQRDTGALNPVCGANPIRSREVETFALDDQDARTRLCGDCRAMAPGTGVALAEVPLTQIIVPENARTASEALVNSVAASGVVVPIIVQVTDTGYLLVAGARRVSAARSAGIKNVPAIMRDLCDPLDSLLENLHREDLDPIALARGYSDACQRLEVSKAELGRRLGVSREQVSNTIRLLQLPEEEQARIAAGEVTATGGRALLRTAPAPAAPALHDVAHALSTFLDLRVRVTGKRITLDVDEADLPRLLAALRSEAAA